MTPNAGSADVAERLIALDWGTSALRAYLLGEGGEVLESRAEAWGIMQLPAGGFAAAFRDITGDWRTRYPDARALAAGMVGSTQGWVEARYCPSPAGVEELARSLAHVPGEALSIVPGIAQLGESPNVMRGEETQIIGAMVAHPGIAQDALLVLPGTHSKWVRVRDGRVHEFTTYLTGELFAVLSAHSILGRLARESAVVAGEEVAARAFARGVLAAGSSKSGMAPLLFSARALVLTGRLEAEASLEYLSGLLIGDELRCGLGEGGPPRALIGDPLLCARYVSALTLLGVGAVPVIEQSAPAGLWSIARRAGLIGPTTSRVVA
jgi:2-dehydro-3-deoxygalactonokinase